MAAPAKADADPDRAARRSSWAVGVAVAAYGVSFGALSVAAGLDVWQTSVLSLLMFTGGSQFALVGVIAAGGTAAGPSAIAGAALLGARNVLYGVRVKPIIGGGFWRQVAAAWLTIDESTAVATAQPTLRSSRIGFWLTGLIVFLGWNTTTLVGAIIGDALGDVRQYGLDAAAAAAFVGLIWPRLTALQPVVVAVGAAVVAAVLVPTLPPGLPVLVAALVAVGVGVTNVWGRRREDAGERGPGAGTAGDSAAAPDPAPDSDPDPCSDPGSDPCSDPEREGAPR